MAALYTTFLELHLPPTGYSSLHLPLTGHFSNPSLRNQMALSKWFWKLKDSGLTPLVRWNLIKRSTTPSNFRSRCNLCQEEKTSIIKYRNTSKLLNQRNELISKRCHKNRYRLM